MILTTSTPWGHPVPHRLADAGLAVRLAAQKPAVPAGDRQRRARGDDAGADLVTVAEAVPQGQRQVAPVPEVLDRRDPHRQRPLCGPGHLLQQRGVVAGPEVADRVVRGVEHQVLVDVDQAGQQRHVP